MDKVGYWKDPIFIPSLGCFEKRVVWWCKYEGEVYCIVNPMNWKPMYSYLDVSHLEFM